VRQESSIIVQSVRDDRGYNQIWMDSLSTRLRLERRCDYMISQMTISPEKNILEIGCGMGTNSFMLAQKTGMRVLGTDLCEPFIEEAKQQYSMPGLRYEVLDFNHAAVFRDERFDYIVGNGILHHLYHSLDEALLNMRRLLKGKGKIIFLEPNLHNPYVYAIFSYAALRVKAHLEPGEMAFSKGWATRKLERAGYRNMKVEYKDFLLPGIPDALIKPSIIVGDVVEKLPLVRMLSQSIFISAENAG
jgi:2-polyprenyl-3-methyl-5-hydroxy-6-metoxy-1,4-benzoquinol methylase